MKKTTTIKVIALLLSLLLSMTGLASFCLPTSAAIAPTQTWYSAYAQTLAINSVSDLWAFATAIENGTTFEGQNVVLNCDITVNEHWDAFADSDAEPSEIWPLSSLGKYFAGTFDGQGHTISGLYAKTSGTGGYGLFGNVPRGKTATVKNLTIVNSKILNENGAKTGGLFGIVSSESNTAITDDYYVNTTRAVAENVHLTINIDARGVYGGKNGGVGGFVGCSSTDVSVKNSSFDGRIASRARGVAAFVGAVYPEKTSLNYDAYKTYTTIENCRAAGTIDVSGEDAIRFAGGLIGYSNANTDCFSVKNVIISCEFIGEHVPNSEPVGYVYGGSWCKANQNRNGRTIDYQIWTVENVFVEKTSENAYPCIGLEAEGLVFSGAIQNFTDLRQYLSDHIFQQLTLQSDFSFHIYIPVIDSDAVVKINGEEILSTPADGWFRRYSVYGLLPQQMNDSITVSVQQTIGSEVFEVSKTTSIQAYCCALWTSDTSTDAERHLVADLLRYGLQAQLYTNYNFSSLSAFEFDLVGWGSEFDAEVLREQYSKIGTANANYDITDVSLVLDSGLKLYFKFTAEDVSNLRARVTIDGRTEFYTAFQKLGESCYGFACFSLNAYQIDSCISVSLEKNGTSIGASLLYSAADYIKTLLLLDASADETLASQQMLAKTIYAYGCSAKSYNETTGQTIIKDNDTDYVIVWGGEMKFSAIAHKLSNAIAEKTGVKIPVKASTDGGGKKEILIGNLFERYASAQENSLFQITDGNGYRIGIWGDHIAIAGESEWLLEYAANRLVEVLDVYGGGSWGIPLGFREIVDLPVYEPSDGISRDVYYAGNQNYTWSYVSSSSSDLTAEYSDYIALLLSDGFVEYTTKTIANNRFGTYVKTTDGYNTVVYTMHYPNSKNMRVTYGPLGYLPSTESSTVNGIMPRVSPSLVVNTRETAYLQGSGMSYVLQLVDGSFILIDSGNGDQLVTTNYKNDAGEWIDNKPKQSEDAKALYELLKEMTSGTQKPVISAWFITHPDSDHIALANQFLEKYHSLVDLKLAVHNFPNGETISYSWNDAGKYACRSAISIFLERIHQYYPDASVWDCHSGQTLYLPECEIEILYTHEDNFDSEYYLNWQGEYKPGTTFFSGNDICICFRIKIGDMSVMIVGDSGWYALRHMADNYKNALESDILQITHHGENGGNYPFYAYVDPKICLWPNVQWRYETGGETGRLLGDANASDKYYNSFAYANWWIKEQEWTRDGGLHGERQQYCTNAWENQVISMVDTSS